MNATWAKHAVAAEGYLELGLMDDAISELDLLRPEDRLREEVLALRLDIYQHQGNWELGAAVADHLVKVKPEVPAYWIKWAYCSRRYQSVEQAEAILLAAAELHPMEAIIFFNLACYSSISGRIEEAKTRLAHAIKIDPEVRLSALDDEDLRPLWDSLTEA